MKFQASLTYFPPNLTSGLNPQDFAAKQVGEYINERGSGLVIPNAKESKEYKLDLIRNAQQSIFLSSYIGEESLDETLDLIKVRMEQKAELKVFILASDHFLTPENKQRFEQLQTTYPNRFFLVLNPEIYYSQHPSGGRNLLSTNHIKLTAIDQGAYWIAGGCALRPFWCDVTGEDHLEKLIPPGLFDVYNPLEAKGFRDMDFMFQSPRKGAGMTAFLEGAKLMVRYAHMQSPALGQQIKEQFLELMQRPAPMPFIPSFESHPDKVEQNFGMKLYSTGPDHATNPYLHALIDLINNAQEKVVVGHMYFHPPQELIDALSNAAARGVKIEIVTNSKDQEAPLAHRFFSDLAQNNYRQLFDRNGHENVSVYEFYRANTTYHKKVVVVDDQYTAFGSTNFGTKSIEENPDDYELNCITESRAFSAKTMEVLRQDMSFSNHVPPHVARNPTWDTRLLAFFQQHVMTHIL